ncbi:MAG TPA: nuclear transport factor 2 family protein [Pyrinomonadaceae bacterium]|nr:nuclear transport factor 2 family protein [Pyrinomonadaceae bacterium]
MRLAIIFLILSIAIIAQGQTPLQDMVKTEQAFSKMAEEKTAREAFLAFIADDGLLFRPGAVNGKKWMIEHPVPPSDKNPLLAWQPNFAGMSASGDMGFTTGPWESKADRSDPKPSAYGHFVTVWKKQRDGSWKWVVDIGISHPQPGGPQTLWHPTDKPQRSKPQSVDPTRALKGLLDAELLLSLAFRERGTSAAVPPYASKELRVYRAGSLPFIGRDDSIAALNRIKGWFHFTTIGGDVSGAGDLGWTHGTYSLIDPAIQGKVIERGSYVRIWKRQESNWQIVLDITNAH